jgi:hypothetical protein
MTPEAANLRQWRKRDRSERRERYEVSARVRLVRGWCRNSGPEEGMLGWRVG